MRAILSVVLAFGLIGAVGPAWAISETHYASVFSAKVRPFWEHPSASGSMEGARQTKIAWLAFEQYSGGRPLVVLPGRSEPAEKYAEVLFDLHARGFNLYILDHRGQGASERLLKDPTLGYVDQFDDYVQDLDTFLNQVVRPRTPSGTKPCILAHSMGGAIAARHLEMFPGAWSAAVLVSPMMQINTAPYPESIGYALIRLLSQLGFARRASPKGKNSEDFPPFERNTVTGSAVRFAMNEELLNRKPNLKIGAPTNRWVYEGIRGGRIIRSQAHQIQTPILLLQAGDERIVVPAGQNEFCSKAKNCYLQAYPGARHEILMEIDSVRDDAMLKASEFCLSNR